MVKKAYPAPVPQILLGLIYFVFGLNAFLRILPAPWGEFPEIAIMGTRLFVFFLHATEMICGLLLLAGYCRPLALVILAPITINIFLFHVVWIAGAPRLILPVAMILLHGSAASRYWELYRPLFTERDGRARSTTRR